MWETNQGNIILRNSTVLQDPPRIILDLPLSANDSIHDQTFTCRGFQDLLAVKELKTKVIINGEFKNSFASYT